VKKVIVAALSLSIGTASVLLLVPKPSYVRPLLKRDLLLLLGRKLEPRAGLALPLPKTQNPRVYPNSASAHKDLETALVAAKVDHKRLLVIFGANWCYDCQVLDAAMLTSQLSTLIASNYHVVHVNVGEGNSNTDLAKRFKVPLDEGIPSLAVLDSSGALITSQQNGEFESSAMIGMNDVSAFLNRWRVSP
jgi:thioredoxin 1